MRRLHRKRSRPKCSQQGKQQQTRPLSPKRCSNERSRTRGKEQQQSLQTRLFLFPTQLSAQRRNCPKETAPKGGDPPNVRVARAKHTLKGPIVVRQEKKKVAGAVVRLQGREERKEKQESCRRNRKTQRPKTTRPLEGRWWLT